MSLRVLKPTLTPMKTPTTGWQHKLFWTTFSELIFFAKHNNTCACIIIVNDYSLFFLENLLSDITAHLCLRSISSFYPPWYSNLEDWCISKLFIFIQRISPSVTHFHTVLFDCWSSKMGGWFKWFFLLYLDPYSVFGQRHAKRDLRTLQLV